VTAALDEFTAGLLGRHGALVDRDEHGIVAVLPPDVAALLGVAELQRFAFDRRAAHPEAVVVDHESALVERFDPLVRTLGRLWLAPSPAIGLKPIDPADVVTRTLAVTNGIIRDCRVEAGTSRYVGFIVQFELLADEPASGLIDVWTNVTTRSVPRLDGLAARLFSREDPSGAAADQPADEELGRMVAEAWTRATGLAAGEARRRLEEALASLRRRRQRDFARLRDYYAAIDAEIRRRARRALAKEDERAAASEVSRLEATAHACRGRVAELIDRYRARLRLAPLAAIVCTLPAHIVTARIHRRSATRLITLAWNPVDRALELPPCDGCAVGVSTAALCDDRVHLLCAGCHAACEACGRPFCHACHARCPRPHH
jgi:hypothetical protein